MWLGSFEHLPAYRRAHGCDPRDERFPEGMLNQAQVRTVLDLDDHRYGKVSHIAFGSEQCISKLTEDIIEFQCVLSKGDFMTRRAACLWLREDGKQIAAAVWDGKNHAESGAIDANTVISYWVPPGEIDNSAVKRNLIETKHKYGMWSLGWEGAIPITRQWIKENYCKEEAAA